jgi:hypothetical protein
MTGATMLELSDADFASLLEGARQRDLRGEVRYAFFTAATLRPSSAPATVLSVFSREISKIGVGLVHAMPLVKGESYELEIRIENVGIRKTCRVAWCRPAGQGWYLSGCQFG